MTSLPRHPRAPLRVRCFLVQDDRRPAIAQSDKGEGVSRLECRSRPLRRLPRIAATDLRACEPTSHDIRCGHPDGVVPAPSGKSRSQRHFPLPGSSHTLARRLVVRADRFPDNMVGHMSAGPLRQPRADPHRGSPCTEAFARTHGHMDISGEGERELSASAVVEIPTSRDISSCLLYRTALHKFKAIQRRPENFPPSPRRPAATIQDFFLMHKFCRPTSSYHLIEVFRADW